MKAAQAGKPLLQWQPQLGTRIGLIALDGSSTQWLDADPFFVFHFGNGFERGGHIVIDYVRHDSLNLGYAAVKQKVPTLHRMRIDLASHKIDDVEIAGMVVEFPRFNDARNALPTRFVYLPTLTDTLKVANPPSATFNTMMKVDCETGGIARQDFGNRIAVKPPSFRDSRTAMKMMVIWRSFPSIPSTARVICSCWTRPT